MELVTVPKFQLSSLSALKWKFTLNVTVDKVFMWTVSTIFWQRINYSNTHPIFIAYRVWNPGVKHRLSLELRLQLW